MGLTQDRPNFNLASFPGPSLGMRLVPTHQPLIMSIIDTGWLYLHRSGCWKVTWTVFWTWAKLTRARPVLVMAKNFTAYFKILLHFLSLKVLIAACVAEVTATVVIDECLQAAHVQVVFQCYDGDNAQLMHQYYISCVFTTGTTYSCTVMYCIGRMKHL